MYYMFRDRWSKYPQLHSKFQYQNHLTKQVVRNYNYQHRSSNLVWNRCTYIAHIYHIQGDSEIVRYHSHNTLYSMQLLDILHLHLHLYLEMSQGMKWEKGR